MEVPLFQLCPHSSTEIYLPPQKKHLKPQYMVFVELYFDVSVINLFMRENRIF